MQREVVRTPVGTPRTQTGGIGTQMPVQVVALQALITPQVEGLLPFTPRMAGPVVGGIPFTRMPLASAATSSSPK